ncbi:MAG: hypothetical protein WAQ05_08250 [Rubrivivax sp.]
MAEALRAGSYTSTNDGSMTAFIEAAMKAEWQLARGEALPNEGAEDRRILFAAIAKGVLRYLYEHRDDLVSTLMHPEGIGSDHHHDAAFDLVEKL